MAAPIKSHNNWIDKGGHINHARVLIPEIESQGLGLLIEMEIVAVLGAERHQRSRDCRGYRKRGKFKGLGIGEIWMCLTMYHYKIIDYLTLQVVA